MQDIQKYIDEAEHGVIYFCLGSLLRGETIPVDKKQMFLNVFKKIPQRILWKWEGEFPEKPPNVMISKWMPQRNILGRYTMQLYYIIIRYRYKIIINIHFIQLIQMLSYLFLTVVCWVLPKPCTKVCLFQRCQCTVIK